MTTSSRERVLFDPATNEQYIAEVEEDLPPVSPGGAFKRTPPPQELQLEKFLGDLNMPPDLRSRFWALTHKLALIKLTRPDEYQVVRMQLENLIRAAYIAADIPDEKTLLDMEMLEFEAGDVELRRSNTYDGKPNERELWTIQSIHQKIERPNEEPQGGNIGLIANAWRTLKGRR